MAFSSHSKQSTIPLKRQDGGDHILAMGPPTTHTGGKTGA